MNGPVDDDAKVSAERGVQGDSPIRSPDQDLFGMDAFSRAIAASIASADANDGLVFAINGPWGSGKSSAANLVLHHLHEELAAGKIEAISFNPWWFSGAEALTLAFFQELKSSVGNSLSETARAAMATIGNRLSSASSLLGGLTSLIATPAAGALATGGAALLGALTKNDTTVEQEHQKLVESLKQQDKRFLIVIDDIDRLATDEALQIFKLVKSVGRLPKVIYLLAFDRHVAEKMVSQRYPAEGPGYLEKIIQGSFDLPLPDPDDLRNQLLQTIETVMGAPAENKMQRFMNIFYDSVAPFLSTPRDVVRLSNTIKVSWPPVARDVDRADFLALEALRLFMPNLHKAIRLNRALLTGGSVGGSNRRPELVAEYDTTFFEGLTGKDKELAKVSLKRLFPKTSSIWGNVYYSDSGNWQRDRLVCSEQHFYTYFAFGIVGEGISGAESDKMVADAAVEGALASFLLHCARTPRRKQGTRAALALDDLRVRSADIPPQHVGRILRELYAIADQLDIPADKRRGFAQASNPLRIHWITNHMVLDRFSLEERTPLIEQAAESSSLNWLIEISDRCKDAKDKADNPAEAQDPLVLPDAADRIYELSRQRLRAAAEDGSLIGKGDLIGLLFRWKDRDGADEVKRWTTLQLSNAAFVTKLAEGLIRESWSQGIGMFDNMGDRVASRHEYVDLESVAEIIDVEMFRRRVDELIGDDSTNPTRKAALERFKATPEENPSRVRTKVAG